MSDYSEAFARIDQLKALAKQRILILDGAMGTMIQREGLSEDDFRGDRFRSWNSDLKGNNDLLNLTRPDVIEAIHARFLEAGADIIETNSFNSTTVSMADYGMQGFVSEINEEGAKIARKIADDFTAKTPNKPRFVAGSIGPTSKTLSVSPDVNNPGYREVEFDQMVATYQQQVEALIKGGVDLILIETVFDTLNAKAAIYATQEAFDAMGIELPIMLSCTITDMSGRNLSGQTIDAFWYSVRHARPFSVGLNCAFGAEHLRAPATQISKIADTHICIFPNAGLPNEMGEYDEEPHVTGAHLGDWAREGLVNIVGGCCGTTPDHIQAIAEAVEGVKPRAIPDMAPVMHLSGLDPVAIVTSQAETDDAENSDVIPEKAGDE